MLTVPDTVAPFAGEVIATTELGVAVGVGVGVGVTLPVGVGVGVAPPFETVTVTEACPMIPLPLFALTEIVWEPFATVVESQLKVNGGEDAR